MIHLFIQDRRTIAVAAALFSVIVVSAQSPRLMPTPYDSTVKVNYVRTWIATSPQTNADTLSSRSLKDVKQTTLYIDGLGRPVQTVVKKGSMVTGNNPLDLVSPIVYDDYEREMFKYLPFAANATGSNTSLNNGLFKKNPFQQDSTFNKGMFSDESWYYGQTVFETSPLNRPLETFAPGDSWVGSSAQASETNRHSVKTKYFFNTAVDSVRIWKVTDVVNGFGLDSTKAMYAEGSLYKNITFDEQNNELIEFKDKDGKVILKKMQFSSLPDTGLGKGHWGWLCTYYIYDDLGQLRCVVQPRGVELLAANGWDMAYSSGVILNEQCFRYEYDRKQRIIMKKVPGAGVVWMVYDTRDRMVLSQDSLLRAAHQWLYSQYDSLNRVVATGLLSDGSNYNNLSYHLTRADTSLIYPAAGVYIIDTLTKAFYDDYSWRTSQGNPLSASRSNSYDSYLQTVSNTIWPYPQDAAEQTTRLTGMMTGNKVKVLGTSTYLFSVNFYDEKGKTVQMQSQNVTTGTDIITTQYDWVEDPLINIAKNEKAVTNTQTNLVLTENTYDSLNRITKVEKKASNTKVNSGAMPGSWKTIAQNEYDELGYLKKKNLGSAPLDSLKYDYNIKGWMLGMNRSYVKDTASTANWFGFDLGYDKTAFTVNGTSKSYAAAQFNGNIGGTLWRSTGDGRLRKYDFTYDAVNRLSGADFNQLTNNNFSKAAGIDFSVSGLNYDANGNILNMNQHGWKVGGSQTIDSLLYTYISNSNKLQNVLDRKNDTLTMLGDFRSSGLYMRTLSLSKNTSASDYSYDGNGNMNIDNNKDISNIHYNHLNLPDSISVTNKGNIKYVYDATGNKLEKITTEGSKITTTLYLIGNYVNDTLQFLPQEEGRIRYNVSDSSFAYDYFLKDHLGNVRMVLTEQQQSDAYPACTMEEVDSTINNKYYSNVTATRNSVPSGYPVDNSYSNPNNFVAKVNGSGNKIGPAIILKVMSGDQFSLRVSSWYKKNGVTPGTPHNPLTDLINALNGNIGSVAGNHGTGTDLSTNNALNPGATSFYATHNSADSTTKPKAFINWVLFDEQFNFVSVNSGFEQVGADNTLTPHSRTGLPISKNGYLYIYASNETPNIDVCFDNLQVTHIRGPLSEETHYYPFGLKMNGISSRGLSFGNPENKQKKFQGQEYNDDLGVDVYEFRYRMDDPQTGRFWQIDPLADKYVYNSTYAFSENKVTNNVELEGLEAATLVFPKDVTDQQKEDFYRGYDMALTRGVRAVGVAGLVVATIVYPPSIEFTAPFVTAEIFGIPSPNAPSSLPASVASETESSFNFVTGETTTNSKTVVTTAENSAASASQHPTLKVGPFAGESIPARSKVQKFTQAERDAVNEAGNTTGCHTCGTKVPGTKSGNFVPDHQPVSKLIPDGTPQRLYPQCLSCSQTQGGATAAALKAAASVAGANGGAAAGAGAGAVK
jgi:RHS repeat-associated protein